MILETAVFWSCFHTRNGCPVNPIESFQISSNHLDSMFLSRLCRSIMVHYSRLIWGCSLGRERESFSIDFSVSCIIKLSHIVLVQKQNHEYFSNLRHKNQGYFRPSKSWRHTNFREDKKTILTTANLAVSPVVCQSDFWLIPDRSFEVSK